MRPEDIFPLRPPLPVPAGLSEAAAFAYLESVRPEDAPEAEMRNYCGQDWRRFLYTWGLARDLTGKCLEIGSNPYFTYMLLHDFTALEVTAANYFGPAHSDRQQRVRSVDLSTRKPLVRSIEYLHFNIETDVWPLDDSSMDVVLFCEVIEHLQMDPISALREIARVLRPGGHLIVTTPNVCRLENVARMIAGANVYDPYSGYGPYGRHNREYNRHELWHLLRYCGFAPETMFTADVHENNTESYCHLNKLRKLVTFRCEDLGQYLFAKCRHSLPTRQKRPDFLYRSYPPGELENAF
jgi:SAM-dependent methyltransferase